MSALKRFFLIWMLLLLAGPAHAVINTPWTGDFDQMVQRRIIRVLVPYSKTFFFLDKGMPKGMTAEAIAAFEKRVNNALKTRHIRVHVMAIPCPRGELLKGLAEGLGDIAAGNLTMTDKRKSKVDFSDPFFTQAREVVVTGPKACGITCVDDLAGKRIHVRFSSSYHDSLVQLNNRFKKQRHQPVRLVRAPEVFEDEDLLEMVNSGMIPMVVVDEHKAVFWAKLLDQIKVHKDIVIRDNGRIGWAVRKDSPELLAVINRFVKTGKQGSLMGNIMIRRYLNRTDYVRATGRQGEFVRAKNFFKKYGERYHIDWLLLKAMAFQESGIDQSKRSRQGAVGVMQLMPATAKDPNVNIPDISTLKNNIHAGAKYLRFLMDRYSNPDTVSETNQALLALAAYNAGPRKVIRLRQKTADAGLNPDIWFGNVEVTAAKVIGRETVQYVNNIAKYYVAYKRIYEIGAQKQKI